MLLEQVVNGSKKTGTESEENQSDEDLDLEGLKKLMSKKDQEASSKKLKSRIKQSGSTFPEDSETEENSETGTDSSDNDSSSKSSRRKSKVKSGAKVKRRPVVRTELWPHTIANEDDGEETTSEDISLAKFLSCFTYIVTTCEKKETAGRSYLLHAVCSILECLPWSEARSFHNLVMVKLEQDRIDWKADFGALATQFIEKKVRQSLRSKIQSTSSMSGNRSGFQSLGKGFGNSYYRGNNNTSKTFFVCRLWNEGICSFGNKCRFRHVCRSCADAGKSGETHKASSQNCPNARRGRSEQRN